MKRDGYINAAALASLVVAAMLALDWFAPVCPFRAITGLLCPGCGMTSALRALVAGDFSGAWYSNPLLFALLLAVILTPAFRKRWTLEQNGFVAACTVIMLVGFAVLRNVI